MVIIGLKAGKLFLPCFISRSFAIRGCYKPDELNSLQNIRIHESFNRKKLRSSGSRFGRLIRFDQSFNSGRSTGGKKRSNLPINTKSRFDLIVRLLSSSVVARALDGKRWPASRSPSSLEVESVTEMTCPAKAYQVEVEETACVIQLRPV